MKVQGAGWSEQQWWNWALGPLELPLADRWQIKKGIPWRVIGTAICLALLAMLYVLSPTGFPGELPENELVTRTAPACLTCPPSEQFSAAGILETREFLWLNVRLAAPAGDSRLRILFEGHPASLALEREGGKWLVAAAPAGAFPVEALRVGVRDSKLIVRIPVLPEIGGVAVASESGDRFPEFGFAVPAPAPPRTFNVVDLSLLVLLAFAAWAGYRRGFVAGSLQVVSLAFVLLLTVVFYHPLGLLLRRAADSHEQRDALAFGLIVTVVGLGAYFATREWGPRILRSTGRLFDRALGPRLNAPLGVPLAWFRLLALAAMVLALSSDLLVFEWAHRAIRTSITAGMLIDSWRTVFPPV